MLCKAGLCAVKCLQEHHLLRSELGFMLISCTAFYQSQPKNSLNGQLVSRVTCQVVRLLVVKSVCQWRSHGGAWVQRHPANC